MKVLCAVLAVGLVVVLWANGAFDKQLSSLGLNAKPCIVVALGGNKLCGDDAKAWCEATDPLRRVASANPDVRQAQRECDKVRGQ